MFGKSKEQKTADAVNRSAKAKLAGHKAEKTASLWARLTA